MEEEQLGSSLAFTLRPCNAGTELSAFTRTATRTCTPASRMDKTTLFHLFLASTQFTAQQFITNYDRHKKTIYNDITTGTAHKHNEYNTHPYS